MANGLEGLAAATLARPGWCGSWRGGAALAVIAIAVYGAGLATIPVTDRDEARFAQASRQMFESVALPEAEQDRREVFGRHRGGLVVPLVQGTERLNKPPLIYWLQAACAALFTGGDPGRDRIWMYRLPSTAAAILSVLATWRLGLRMFDPRAAWWAGLFLAVAPAWSWEARQARADHVLVAATTVAMAALWPVWRCAARERRDELVRVAVRRGTKYRVAGWRDGQGPALSAPSVRRVGWGVVITLWAAMSAAVLTKGPVAPLVAGLTVLALSLVSRRWRWVGRARPVLGAVIVALAVAPWVVMVAGRVGPDRYASIVWAETLGRSAAPREGHWGPPGYHALAGLVLLWPGSLLLAPGVARGLARGLMVLPRPGAGLSPLSYRGWGLRLRAMGSVLRRSRPRRPAECYLVAWLVTTWLVFELVMTKLPHYTMPAYPAAALLSARAMLAAASGARKPGPAALWKLSWGAWLFGGLVASAALVAGGAARGWGVFTAPGVAAIALSAASAAGLIGCGLVVGWLFVRSHLALLAGWHAEAMGRSVLAAVVAAVVLAQFVLPGPMSLSSRVSAAIAAADPAGVRPVGLVGYHEDSMIFLTRGRAERIRADDAPAWIETHPGGLVVAPRLTPMFLRPSPGFVLGEFEGFNYTRGRIERLLLIDAPAYLEYSDQSLEERLDRAGGAGAGGAAGTDP